jgi:hypothetical protein
MKEIKAIAIKNWLRNIGLTVFMLTAGLSAMACEACKKQQPKLLQGITHGRGPDSSWDYVILMVMIIVTLYVLFATVKCIFRPSEKNDEHIKRLILND